MGDYQLLPLLGRQPGPGLSICTRSLHVSPELAGRRAQTAGKQDHCPGSAGATRRRIHLSRSVVRRQNTTRL